MKKHFLFFYLIIMCIAIPDIIKGQSINVYFPVNDTTNCGIEFNLPNDYGKFIPHNIKGKILNISKDYLRRNDSIFLIKVPDTINLPSLFLTSEQLQNKKTPVPDSLSNYIVRQYQYHKVKITEVKIEQLFTQGKMEISKLSFKMNDADQYMVNYSMFINNRSLTIGLNHSNKEVVNKYDNLIINLRTACP